MATYQKVSQFKGINNVSDPLRLGLGWLSEADNIDISDTGAITRRTGYVMAKPGEFTDAYASDDLQRMFVVTGGSISSVAADMTLTPVATVTTSAPMYWAEVNKHTYFNNGTDRGVIPPSGPAKAWEWPVPAMPHLAAGSGALPPGTYRACCTHLMPDGSETGSSLAQSITLAEGRSLVVSGIPQVPGLTTLLYIAPADSTVFQLVGNVGAVATWNSSPDDLGTDLTTKFLDPIPVGATVIQHWMGRMFAAQYLPIQDQSVVWVSEPLGFHLFNLNSGMFMVPGQVHALVPTDGALIVAAGEAIYAYTGEELKQLAPYGVVPGVTWARQGDKVLLWTKRGVCRLLPFENTTEGYVSVAPGSLANTVLMQRNGQRKFVAMLSTGGAAFNQRL